MIPLMADASNVDGVSHLIQLSVAPVFLLAAVGGILGVFSGRLSRIIDKVEKINNLISNYKADDDLDQVNEHKILRQILEQRAKNMNLAILFCTLTGFLIALVIMTMFLSAFFAFEGAIFIAILFILAMLSFVIALMLFFKRDL